MNHTLNIHPELRAIKAHRLPTNRWMLAALQTFLSAVNALHRRRFKSFLSRASIPGADGNAIHALVVRAASLDNGAPALVYFHGGAFVMKPAPQHLENALFYAREARCVVIFVEYRLAPKHPFPAGFNDCHAALRWTVAHAHDLGIDPARIAVGGDSAGGLMAAVVAQRARHEDGVELCGQMLIYPVVDLLCARPSISAYADVPPFSKASPQAITETYLGGPAPAVLPRFASPMAGDAAEVAPAYIETAQFDLLHDQGAAYARLLIENGVRVELCEVEGGVHGFDLLAPKSSVARDAIQGRVRFLRSIFES
jgi:acetyl esterase